MTSSRTLLAGAATLAAPLFGSGAARAAWYGLFVPAGTPREIVTKLHAEMTKLLAAPEIKERFAGLGVEAAPSTPEQLATLMRDDLVRWGKIVKDSGAHID